MEQPVTFLANAALGQSRGASNLISGRNPLKVSPTFASFTYDDTYFASFANAACPFELTYKTTSCNLTGQTLPITPKFAMSLGGEYSRHLDLFDGSQPKTGDRLCRRRLHLSDRLLFELLTIRSTATSLPMVCSIYMPASNSMMRAGTFPRGSITRSTSIISSALARLTFQAA